MFKCHVETPSLAVIRAAFRPPRLVFRPFPGDPFLLLKSHKDNEQICWLRSNKMFQYFVKSEAALKGEARKRGVVMKRAAGVFPWL